MIKTVNQYIVLSNEIQDLMHIFRNMVNECIRIGLQNNITSLKALSKESYHHLTKYNIIAYYKLNAISKASGILQNRKKSITRGFKTKNPYLRENMIITNYGFKIDNDLLKIPLGNRRYFEVKLNSFIIKSISTLKVHSFSISSLGKLSISYSNPITENIECTSIVGIDRNLNNITVGNKEKITKYNLEKCNTIIDNTKSIYRCFKRNDHRIRKKIYSKYGQRRRNRINKIIHKISKDIVTNLKENKQGIAFEKLSSIRKLYKKGNGQGRYYRGIMNSWSFGEIKRQIDYKSKWEGIKVIEIDPRYTSSTCSECGKRTQRDIPTRKMSCLNCNLVWDRDVLAAINIAKKGGEVFHRSKGLPVEARKQSKDAESMEESLFKKDCIFS